MKQFFALTGALFGIASANAATPAECLTTIAQNSKELVKKAVQGDFANVGKLEDLSVQGALNVGSYSAAVSNGYSVASTQYWVFSHFASSKCKHGTIGIVLIDVEDKNCMNVLGPSFGPVEYKCDYQGRP